MKHGLLSFILVCIFILSMAGCSSNEEKTSAANTQETSSEQQTKAQETSSINEIDLSLSVPDHKDWSLPGTLTLPDGDGPFPAVVLVHGSGPNDRDETVYENKPFKDIADGLAAQGIAVYRYDKRTLVYGKDMISDTNLTLDDETVIDAVAAVQLLSEQPEIDSSRIYVLGHSLGGQALPRINQALNSYDILAAGYIFLAAPARDLATLSREQYDFLYSLTPVLTDTQKAQKEQTYAQLDLLDQLDTLPSSQPILGAYPAYWKDLLTYDAVTEAQNIMKPCLVLQGEEDYQVTMTDFNLWKEAFSNNSNWTFNSYSGLTHLFMEGKYENANASYLNKQNVDSEVILDIADFVLNQ